MRPKDLQSQVKPHATQVVGPSERFICSTGLTVCVYIGGFWPLRFYGVHFTHDSQNSFSAHHDSPTANMVDGGIMKIS